MFKLSFSKQQAQCILHRLGCCDDFEYIFRDNDHLSDLADTVVDRASAMEKELEATGAIMVDQSSELDRSILVECIEGSTWIAAFDRVEFSSQKAAAAKKTLRECASLVSGAFSLGARDIEVPCG